MPSLCFRLALDSSSLTINLISSLTGMLLSFLAQLSVYMVSMVFLSTPCMVLLLPGVVENILLDCQWRTSCKWCLIWTGIVGRVSCLLRTFGDENLVSYLKCCQGNTDYDTVSPGGYRYMKSLLTNHW
jgi:hypothetical protein